MKRIGVLFGQERSFPYALVARINELKAGAELKPGEALKAGHERTAGGELMGDEVVAEPVSVGGVGLESPKRYDLVLDRISQDIPFYRAILKKLVADGTIVVNNPFWWSADDKFFNNVVARRVGVAVPKTVILPSNQHPPDTTSESMSNLVYPLDWDGIFAYVGFPAYFKPYAGGGWKHVYRVGSPDEFFTAYRDSGQHVMTLQEEIVFEEYVRCYVIGRKYVRIMRYDPRRPHFQRYVTDAPPLDPALEKGVHDDCLTLASALGYDFDTMEFAVRGGVPYAIDFLNPAPDADVNSIGQDNFEWVVDHAARWLIERVQQGAEPLTQFHWSEFLSGGCQPAAGEALEAEAGSGKHGSRRREPGRPRGSAPTATAPRRRKAQR